MRTENIELTMKMSLPINKPDKNGVMYAKEAFIEAFKEAKGKPLEIVRSDGSYIPVGIVQSINYVIDCNGDYALVSASLFHGGTCEEIDFRNGYVTSMTLTNVGISR